MSSSIPGESMRKWLGSFTIVLLLAAIAAAPSAASDASIRSTIRHFQPGLASAAAGLQASLRAKATPAGFARLDAATRRYLATVKLDRLALQLQKASTSRGAKGRATLLTALVRLSQAATSLDAALQAAKRGHRKAAARSLRRSTLELSRALRGERRAVGLLRA